MMRLGPRRADWLVTALLALGTVVWLLSVEGRQGIGRDEAQYMRAGERYWGWFSELGDNLAHGRPGRSFTPSDIDLYWSDNAPDHPVVMKALYGLSWRAFHSCSCMGATHGLHPVPVPARHTTLPLFSRDSTAFRFPAILFAALLVGLVYRFARGWLSRAPSAVAAVLTLAQPHFFFHAQIACFDAPIVTMAFAVGFGYWKSLRDPRWGIATGALFGVALGVKHNAWLVPFFLVAHYLWMRRGDLRARRLTPIPLVFVSMLVLGPLIFFAHWPWLWVAPAARTRAYVLRHLEHEHYNFEYLGYNFNQPPTTTAMKWLRATAPFVETGFTVPVTTLALAAIGAGLLARRRRDAPVDIESEQLEAPTAERPSWLRPGADVDRAPGAFVLFQTLGPMAVLAVPSTPIFGGVKHFLAAMPYLAVMAGIGLAAIGRALRDALPEARARWRLCHARRAGAPRLPPRARRDAPLAPRRSRALQPARGRLRRRRVARHEPAVLGLLGAADAPRPRSPRPRQPQALLARHPLRRDLDVQTGRSALAGGRGHRLRRGGHQAFGDRNSLLRKTLGQVRGLVLAVLRDDPPDRRSCARRCPDGDPLPAGDR